MMACRGMGAISPSKMPKGKTVERKDNPNTVEAFKRGGKIKDAECDCTGGKVKGK